MKRLVAVAAGILSVLALAACGRDHQAAAAPRPIAPTGATATREPRTITGVGVGRVRGKPDTLTLTIGVESQARSANDALSRNRDAASKMIDGRVPHQVS